MGSLIVLLFLVETIIQWHSYKADGKNNRLTLVYNLRSDKVLEKIMFDKIDSLKYFDKEVKFYTPTKKTAGRVKKIFRKEPITITWMDNMKQGDIVIDIGAQM